MSRNPEGKYYKGKWLFYCDVCNKKMLSCDAKKRWDGLYVCKNDWEPRHPSDFIRARKETSNQLPWSRPGLNGGSGDIAAPSVGPRYSVEYVLIGGNADVKFGDSGPFYFYDPAHSVYQEPQAYVTGNYF